MKKLIFGVTTAILYFFILILCCFGCMSRAVPISAYDTCKTYDGTYSKKDWKKAMSKKRSPHLCKPFRYNKKN